MRSRTCHTARSGYAPESPLRPLPRAHPPSFATVPTAQAAPQTVNQVEELSRTVHVGNLSPVITVEQLKVRHPRHLAASLQLRREGEDAAAARPRTSLPAAAGKF